MPAITARASHHDIKARVIAEGCAPPAHYVIIFVAARLHKVAQRLEHAEARKRHAAVRLIGKPRHLCVARGETGKSCGW